MTETISRRRVGSVICPTPELSPAQAVARKWTTAPASRRRDKAAGSILALDRRSSSVPAISAGSA